MPAALPRSFAVLSSACSDNSACVWQQCGPDSSHLKLLCRLTVPADSAYGRARMPGFKNRLCKYWLDGICTKLAAQCPFAHGQADLRQAAGDAAAAAGGGRGAAPHRDSRSEGSDASASVHPPRPPPAGSRVGGQKDRAEVLKASANNSVRSVDIVRLGSSLQPPFAMKAADKDDCSPADGCNILAEAYGVVTGNVSRPRARGC